jgi:hypothetical protein
MDLDTVSRGQIRRAGARYTPGIDPNAPNVEVRDLALALAALASHESCRAHIRGLERSVRERVRWGPKAIERAFRGRKFTPGSVADALEDLASAELGEREDPARELTRALRHVQRRLTGIEAILYEKERTAETDQVRQKLRRELNEVHRVLSPIQEVAEFVASPTFALLTNNTMLLLGTWGTGKTHSLCDLTEQRTRQGLPTLLYLAHSLPYSCDPLQGLCDETGFAATAPELLQGLQQLGETTRSRALLIVDGINEGNRSAWTRSLTSIIRAVRPLTHVGLVLSCRQPFDELIFTPRTRSRFVTVEHRGFEENEVDAQVEFFTYYGIPAPHAPLLTPEFSRPLFLKMLCESVRSRSIRSKSRYVRDLASGQRGMTLVLEDFAKEVGRPLERDFGLPRLTCWRLLKGDKAAAGAPLVGIAPAMARAMEDYISRAECLSLIESFTSWGSVDRCEELLQRLLADGLIVEGIRWSNREPTPVIQFPYQRFGDHLIARTLLENHLHVQTESAIRRSFYVNRPLGRIFELTRGGMSYQMPGLASAIMLEFPERVKRALPSEERELVAYLPRERQLAAPLRDVFLEGLYWRPADSFTKQTEHIINFYLNQPHEWTRNEVLEVLASLATRAHHPYSANWLHGLLARQTMPDRDLFWSEFLRRSDRTSAVVRLLEWIERTEGRPRDRDIVENCVTLLSLCLTTTRRALRDRVTRALYLVGLADPRALFNSTVASLEFNDPYVPERMLAASYGVAMSMWADPRGGTVQAALPQLARDLARRMFLPRGRNRTAHVLIQDYALGMIELARRVAPRCVPRQHLQYLGRPLKTIRSPFPSARRITEEEAGKVKSALRMDFENYTLGRLVPGRGNYDFQHKAYRVVRRQVLWRVADLGYSEEKFSSIDREIAQSSREDDPSKTDRYGKKYSWVAFFEMYGVRRINGRLARWSDERPSDVDIDPSFPNEPRSWVPPRSGILESGPSESRAWLRCGLKPDYEGLLWREEVDGIRGPWILIEGFIEESANQEAARTDKRRLFTFLWARLTERVHLDQLLAFFWARDYPGNSVIPEHATDYYTYAGEIPWSARFASGLRSATGGDITHIEVAFPVYDRSLDGRTGIPVEIPIFCWAWESYHSAMNQVGPIYVPAPALCQSLKLVNHAREWDLFDGDGQRATLFVKLECEGTGLDCHLLFLRQDLLNRYLTNASRELVWFVWGERDLKWDALQANRDEWSEIFQRYENIHRCVYVWNADMSSVVADVDGR